MGVMHMSDLTNRPTRHPATTAVWIGAALAVIVIVALVLLFTGGGDVSPSPAGGGDGGSGGDTGGGGGFGGFGGYVIVR